MDLVTNSNVFFWQW